ncbi:MAG: type II toxin-antitoxin system RelE/ParE family toxin [Rhodobacteraceae bacterium]|nr:type II toxin-antitoxin system RelE/ParE family toxin [Paracoccaceae bacterium]
MIQSTKGKRAGDAVQNNYKGFPADLVRRTQALLTALNGAAHINDLRSPPGNRLKKLKDNRQGQYSLRINDQWRICFVWTPNGPANVEIVDYH